MPKNDATPCPSTTNHDLRTKNHEKNKAKTNPKRTQFWPKNEGPNPKFIRRKAEQTQNKAKLRQLRQNRKPIIILGQ
jgi:hypothetical protein